MSGHRSIFCFKGCPGEKEPCKGLFLHETSCRSVLGGCMSDGGNSCRNWGAEGPVGQIGEVVS